ncbi:MAG: LysR family transcriptional regulator [Rhizobium sp.]|nr:MAG: LysR family transcriptional regulator [Rhizobium sp.]
MFAMPLRLPPLPSLRQFEAAARHKSFTRAAEELGQTASAVSHAIDSLETWLGASLFSRTARGVVLTSAGQYFLPYVSEGLSTIALGTRRLPGRRTERHLVISATSTFAQRFLIPKLPLFRKRHPGIRLTIDTANRQMLFPLDGADMSVRYGAGVWPDARSELLFRERLIPVASPEYLASVTKRGSVDWSAVTFLRLTSVEQDWSAWIDASGTRVMIGDELCFDTVHLVCEAAAMGLGMALGRLPIVSSQLDSGRLKAAAGQPVETDAGYWVVSPLGQEMRTAARAFREWLLEEVRDDTGAGSRLASLPTSDARAYLKT